MYRERDTADLAGLDDGTLVERSRQGDVEAFGELVRRYQDLAQRTAYVIMRDADNAADASQEAFVKAYRAIGRFRTGAPLRPWLLRIVANEAVNRARASSRHAHAELALAEGVTADPAASPEEAALQHERRSSVLRALDRMREDDRVVIAYRYFFEMTEAEMAEALGVARGTVKSRLSRALGRMRELM